MNNTAAEFEQTEEAMLAFDVSDEALEAAAGTERPQLNTMFVTLNFCCAVIES